MTIIPDTLREIEEKAKAAMPGPWELIWHGNEQYPYPLSIHADNGGVWVARDGTVSSHANAAHIARMDPPTTLALVARIRELEEALKPFADEAPRYDPPEGDDNYLAYDSRFTLGDLRRAATAYKGEKG